GRYHLHLRRLAGEPYRIEYAHPGLQAGTCLRRVLERRRMVDQKIRAGQAESYGWRWLNDQVYDAAAGARCPDALRGVRGPLRPPPSGARRANGGLRLQRLRRSAATQADRGPNGPRRADPGAIRQMGEGDADRQLGTLVQVFATRYRRRRRSDSSNA